MRILILETVLIILSYTDLKDRTIDLRVLIGAVICAMCFNVKLSPLGMIPGIALILFSKISRDNIGSGDGYVFMITGLMGGFYENAYIMLLAFLVSGINSSIALLLLERGNAISKTKIPLVPYILLSFNAVIILEHIYSNAFV